MAGKHISADENASLEADWKANIAVKPACYPGSVVDRAFAEGRQASVDGLTAGANPHAGEGFSSPSFLSWNAGLRSKDNSWSDTQHQTAVE